MDQYLPKKRDADAAGEETAPVVLAPSRSKAGLFLLLGTIFLAMGAVLLVYPEPLPRIFGGLGMLLGLVGAAAAVGMRISGSTHLALDEGGMTHRHLWRDVHIAWDDISKIGVFHQAGNRMVVYDVPPDHPQGRGLMARLNRGVCGCSHAIPDAYGGSPEELAELLEAWRVAYSTPQLPEEAEEPEEDPG